ncbi:MAG TPA: 3-methyl-2-oxobutanoate dehydrogenase subunit beta [Thermodesulfobacteriota bacterium]|nr:3-methyl-2-oxobutanoate dehydrogenase subunit beta [Thermodesulfobacteriota bacterium]
MKKINIPTSENLGHGHLACAGCGAAVAMRLTLKALGAKTVMVFPASCWSIIPGPWPYSSIHIPVIHAGFVTGGATASGVRAALDIRGYHDTVVAVWAGDGGTFDIGIQALSGAAERNEDFIYICNDNEAYMNTGTQRSSATPCYAWTTTTPTHHPKEDQKKDIMAIMADHHIPYAATATISYPEDFIRKMEKAKRIKGTRFIHLLSPCPPGWKIPSELTVKLSRLAVRTRIFPLYEIEDGKYTIQEDFVKDRVPMQQYLRLQGRFSHLKDQEVESIQKAVDEQWERLQRKARC